MLSLENAVPDTLEELELEEFIDYDIREVQEGVLYHVTFQEKENGNNKVVISVEYSRDVSDLLDDDAWDGDVDVYVIQRHGISPMMAEMITELLSITIDADYFDSDSEEEDSDDETASLPSQPQTPPPRPSQPLAPPPLPRRHR
jgi:hypothetical protein